jgi:hypothetical protein
VPELEPAPRPPIPPPPDFPVAWPDPTDATLHWSRDPSDDPYRLTGDETRPPLRPTSERTQGVDDWPCRAARVTAVGQASFRIVAPVGR